MKSDIERESGTGKVKRFILKMKSHRGLTLIELVAVMAIIAILAAIVFPAASGTGESSRDAQTKQDAGTVGNSGTDFFKDQNAAEVLTPKTVTVQASINGDTATSTEQVTSSRWPELFITNGSTTAKYFTEFPTSTTTVRAVNILDKDGNAVSRSAFLTGFTAIDLDRLKSEGYLEKVPAGADRLSKDIAHDFLWTFEKKTSAGGAGESDSRSVAVYKLTKVQEDETVDVTTSTKRLVLTYKRIY